MSSRLAELIRTLLTKDPDDRYQNATALAADLRRLIAHASVALTLGRETGKAAAGRMPRYAFAHWQVRTVILEAAGDDGLRESSRFLAPASPSRRGFRTC